MEPLEGIAAADALLGRPFPLPAAALPLVRWVEVRAHAGGAEVEWNLDDTRPGSPGRLALFAGTAAPPPQLSGAETTTSAEFTVSHAPLAEAQPSLRPVLEVSWTAAGVRLRLTAQGPWALVDVLRIARSVG